MNVYYYMMMMIPRSEASSAKEEGMQCVVFRPGLTVFQWSLGANLGFCATHKLAGIFDVKNRVD